MERSWLPAAPMERAWASYILLPPATMPAAPWTEPSIPMGSLFLILAGTVWTAWRLLFNRAAGSSLEDLPTMELTIRILLWNAAMQTDHWIQASVRSEE